MRVEKILTVAQMDPNEKGIDLTRHMTGRERVSLVEDLRIEMARVCGYEYPRKVERTLEICKREGDTVRVIKRGG